MRFRSDGDRNILPTGGTPAPQSGRVLFTAVSLWPGEYIELQEDDPLYGRQVRIFEHSADGPLENIQMYERDTLSVAVGRSRSERPNSHSLVPPTAVIGERREAMAATPLKRRGSVERAGRCHREPASAGASDRRRRRGCRASTTASTVGRAPSSDEGGGGGHIGIGIGIGNERRRLAAAKNGRDAEI